LKILSLDFKVFYGQFPNLVADFGKGGAAAYLAAAVAAVRNFDAFSEDSDRYGEHDFGAF